MAKKLPDKDQMIMRLAAVKTMIAGMGDALPTTARELRRAARESLDDLISDLR